MASHLDAKKVDHLRTMRLLRYFFHRLKLFIVTWPVPILVTMMVLTFLVVYNWQAIEPLLQHLLNPTVIIVIVILLAIFIYAIIDQFRITSECLKCGSFDSKLIRSTKKGDYLVLDDYECQHCGHVWTIESDTQMNQS